MVGKNDNSFPVGYASFGVGKNRKQELIDEEAHQKALEVLRKKYDFKKFDREIRENRNNAKKVLEIQDKKRKAEKELDEKANKIAYLSYQERYKKLNIIERKAVDEESKYKLDKLIKDLALETDVVMKSKNHTAKQKEEIEKRNSKKIAKIAEQQKVIDDRVKKETEIQNKADLKFLTIKETFLKKQANANKTLLEDREKLVNLEAEKNLKLSEATSDEEKASIMQSYQDNKKQIQDDMSKANKELVLASAIVKLSDSVSKAFDDVDKEMSTYYQYQSKVQARIQGSDKSYSKMASMIEYNVGLNPIIQQKKMLENLNKLIEQGVVYNVEERAFLETVSDKIATTFDAANGTLLRLIRLQQSDSTAARLGLEASLTGFFNNMFQDTSYLSNVYDSVSEALIDANSQMAKDQSAEFEYTIQKWLGSLSAVGMSDSSIGNIATGLNYLGTGNVSALSSNQSLQTLFAMAANRAGLSYASLLTEGLNSKDTNKLLESMVEYLQEISQSQNKVVKSQYANIFDMSLSDFRAINNLTSEDLTTIASTTMSYRQDMQELTNQFGQTFLRTPLAEQIENIYQNAITSMATSVAQNPATYAMWKVNSFIEEATGGINIPFAEAAGFGLDLNANVNQLAKLGIIGISTLGQIGSIIGSVGSFGGFNLSSWNGSDYMSRGDGLTGILSGIIEGISYSGYISNASSADAYNATIVHANENANDVSEITGANDHMSDKTANDVYEMLFEKQSVPIQVTFNKDEDLEVRLNSINDDLSSTIKSYIESIVLQRLSDYIKEGVFGTADAQSDGLSDKYTINDLINKIMNESVSVDVNDDYFQTAMMKVATANSY